MNVSELLASRPPPYVVRAVVDHVPRALWRVVDDAARARVEAAAVGFLAALPAHASARLELADDEDAAATAALAVSPSAAPVAPATPADQLRGVLGAVEGLGRLGLSAVGAASAAQVQLLDRYAAENVRLRQRITELEDRITAAWERDNGRARDVVEAEREADRERALLDAGIALARMLGARLLGTGAQGDAARFEALRQTFATVRPDQLATILGALDDAQRIALLDALNTASPTADEPPTPARRRNRGQA